MQNGSLGASRIDENGDRVWDYLFGVPISQSARAVTAVREGGYLLAGRDGTVTCCHGRPEPFWLRRIDEAGRELWMTKPDQPNYVGLRSIHQTADGGYIIAGVQIVFIGVQSTISDGYVSRVDGRGNRLWDGIFGGDSDDLFHDAILAPNEEIICVGFSASQPGTGNKTSPVIGMGGWAVRLSADGQKVGEQSYVGSLVRVLAADTTTGNGHLFLAQPIRLCLNQMG